MSSINIFYLSSDRVFLSVSTRPNVVALNKINEITRVETFVHFPNIIATQLLLFYCRELIILAKRFVLTGIKLSVKPVVIMLMV